ncbi:unnamed protein product [Ceratitis capitata]|uniref:(Mediterranean fruit fly) hypothetical protein n=1 Tax=Ceratitis capitata TaxID=7213 RepID=A0A811VFZ0_CERCA|nr:unnamed protein product [Ceratitis capitata]
MLRRADLIPLFYAQDSRRSNSLLSAYEIYVFFSDENSQLTIIEFETRQRKQIFHAPPKANHSSSHSLPFISAVNEQEHQKQSTWLQCVCKALAALK